MVTIRMRLPIIRSGARVPIRSEICTSRWTALASLVRRTISWPVFCSVEVGEGEGLDPGEKRLAQVAGHALAHLDGEDVVADGEQGAQQRDAEHQQRGLDDDLLVVPPDPLIDDPLDQPGDRQVHEDQRGQQDQGQDGAPPVGFDERGEFEDLVHGSSRSFKFCFEYIHPSGVVQFFVKRDKGRESVPLPP